MGAQGTAVVDFGAYPGAGSAVVSVTGQAAILTTSACEAWVRVQDATAEHTPDEHIVETLTVRTGPIVAADGFPIHVTCDNSRAWGTFNINWVWN